MFTLQKKQSFCYKNKKLCNCVKARSLVGDDPEPVRAMLHHRSGTGTSPGAQDGNTSDLKEQYRTWADGSCSPDPPHHSPG